jgi:transcriptional regulator CtsR
MLGIKEAGGMLVDPSNYIDVVRNAVTEVGDIAKFGGKVIKGAFSLPTTSEIITKIPSVVKKIPDAVRKTPGVLRQIPEVGSDIVLSTLNDFGKAFGVDVPNTNVGVDVALQAFIDKPITDIMNISIVKGLASKGILSLKEGKALKNAIDESAGAIKEAAVISNIPVDHPIQQLLNVAPDIKDIPFNKLKSEQFILGNKGVGVKFKENLANATREETNLLKSQIAGYKDDLIDTDIIKESLNKLLETKLPSTQLRDFQVSKIAKSPEGKIINSILNKKAITVQEANDIRTTLGNMINWTDPTEAQKVYMQMYEAIRGGLASETIRPDLNSTLSRVSERLQNFQPLEQQIAKAGGGVDFAKNVFENEEKYNMLLNNLLSIPNQQAQMAVKDLKTMYGWHRFNTYAGDVKEFSPAWMRVAGGFPVPLRGIERFFKGRLGEQYITKPDLAKRRLAIGKGISTTGLAVGKTTAKTIKNTPRAIWLQNLLNGSKD